MQLGATFKRENAFPSRLRTARGGGGAGRSSLSAELLVEAGTLAFLPGLWESLTRAAKGCGGMHVVKDSGCLSGKTLQEREGKAENTRGGNLGT